MKLHISFIATFISVIALSKPALGHTGVEKEIVSRHLQVQLEQLARSDSSDRQNQFERLLNEVKSHPLHQNLFAQGLADLLSENPSLKPALSSLDFQNVPLTLHLQLADILDLNLDFGLQIKAQREEISDDETLLRALCAFQTSPKLAIQKIFLANPELTESCNLRLQAVAPPSAQQLKDLLFNTPDARNFAGGKYFKKPKIFQLCRTHRQYTCQMIIKDGDGRWHRNSDGSIWSQEKLSLSRAGKAYNEFSGDTPSGLYTIDGVMPVADKQIIYGRHRRLIMEFIPASKSELTLKSLLPDSNHGSAWWQESVVARDMGRDLFRIHGTLRRNEDPQSTYFPFYPTAGCVATKEGQYGGIDYDEQRPLLDELMKISGFQPIYENETKLLALFYVVEINSETRAVTRQDLARLGLQ